MALARMQPPPMGDDRALDKQPTSQVLGWIHKVPVTLCKSAQGDRPAKAHLGGRATSGANERAHAARSVLMGRIGAARDFRVATDRGWVSLKKGKRRL